MFLYLPTRRLPKIGREFMGFVRSQEAQELIRSSGFVDQALEETPINLQGDRLVNAIEAAGPDVPLEEVQRLVETLSPMARLTLSFRFEAGETTLDAQSRSNIVRLSRALEQGAFDGRQVIFVGFSDGEGPAERNRQIALSRSQAVRDAVREMSETADFSRIDLQVDAFGEAMPLACDDSVWGRKANRRVEVWVR
jgi:phosphate transport system substrate-binding protein